MNQERTYFQRNIVRAFAAAGVVWTVTILMPDGFLAPFRAVLAPIAAPLQGFVSWIAFETGDAGRFFSSISELKRENDRLVRDNQRLTREAASLAEREEENRLLREVLALPRSQDQPLLSAEVISRDTRESSFSFTLNRGSLDGVQIGFPIIIGNGQLVGRVASVNLTSSTAHLLSHPESTVAARIAGTSVQGVIRGDHGLGLIFDMVLSGEPLNPGARLVSSGLGDGLPAGLYIGEIGQVRLSVDRLFQQATILTSSVESDIRFVSIITLPSP